MPRVIPALTIHFAADATDDERGIATSLLSDFSTVAIHELTDTEWRVFFRTAPDRDAAATALARDHSVSPLDVPDEDWARKSQEGLHAITVGEIVVAPPWDLPNSRGRKASRRIAGATRTSDGGRLTIVIEPSTGFGTGHHATTRLCLRALQEIELRGRTVIDVGTGSGVLAIAASLRGAASVIAIDNDPDALDAARGNIARNAARVDLRLGDVHGVSLPRADVVLANLTGAMLRRNAAGLASLAPGGVLIVSGFLAEEVPDVSAAFAPFSASSSRQDEDGWAGIVLRT